MSALLQNWAKRGATIDTIAPAYIHNGIPFHDDGTLAVDTVSAVDHHHQGLPFTAVSRLAVTLAAPTSFGSGSAGFAGGRLCVTEFGGGPVYAHGNNYVNSGVVIEPLAGGAVLEPPINGAGVGSFPPAEIDLTWTDNPANDNVATSYVVSRAGEADVIITAPTVAYTDTRNLLPDTAYTHTIRTVNVDGTSGASGDINTAIPNLVLPAAPITLIAQSAWASGEFMRLEWTDGGAGSFATAGYLIFRNGIEVFDTAGVVLVGFPPATLGDNDNWTVLAYDINGNEGVLSALLNHTFIPRQPVHLWDETSIQATLTDVTAWNDAVGAVDIATVGANTPQVIQVNGLDAVEAAGGVGSFMHSVDTNIAAPFTAIYVGLLESYVDAGGGDTFNFLTDGDPSGGTARVFVINTPANQMHIGMAGSSGGTITPINNATPVPHTFMLVHDAARINGYIDNILRTDDVVAGANFGMIQLLSDNSDARPAPAGSWLAEVMVIPFEIDAFERTYWQDVLAAKWGL